MKCQRTKRQLLLGVAPFLLAAYSLSTLLRSGNVSQPIQNHVADHALSKKHPIGTITQQLSPEQAANQSHAAVRNDAALATAKPPNSTFENDTSYGSNIRLCDMECWRFQELLKNWPEGKPKAAIYYLTYRFVFLNRSLHSLDLYFNREFKYPVIIFHEKSFRPLRRHVLKLAPDVYFQEIEFKIPNFLSKDRIPKMTPCLSFLEYRHMCRFQAKLVYEEPIMDGLDYYWRLDDDSLINEPIKYDVFSFMRDRDLQYGYRWIHLDSFLCTAGLWEASADYVKLRGIKPYFFDEWSSPTIYYNNFEISALSFWKSQSYRDYIDYIDKLGGIYYTRWGDAPIKGIAVSIFMPRKKTHLFKDIAYEHGSYDSRRVST